MRDRMPIFREVINISNEKSRSHVCEVAKNIADGCNNLDEATMIKFLDIRCGAKLLLSTLEGSGIA